MKKLSVFLFIMLLTGLLAVSGQQGDKIQWISFQEALEKNKKAPRKIMMDVYTDWCGWCKHMDKTTFTDPNIIAYINANYYAVKFDAEGNDSVFYKGKVFKNTGVSSRPGRKPTHPLAVEVLQGQMSYPNIVYFDDSSNVITAAPGYRSAKDIQPFLIYFNENLHKYINLQGFIGDFNSTLADSTKSGHEAVKWLSMSEAIRRQATEKKKIMINLQTDWCITCKIMDNVAFNNPKLAEYINNNTLPVRFNATTQDTIHFNNFTFINENKGHPFHQFAVSVLNGKMKFPTMVFVGDKGDLITSVPGYMIDESIEPIVKYFVSDKFKTLKWEDYQKTFVSDLK